MTKNNNAGLTTRLCNWNEYNLNPLTSINWRASLVPAAAVIPAPIAYIKIVAVKKLVVGSQVRCVGVVYDHLRSHLPFIVECHFVVFFTERCRVLGTFTLKKSECSKQAFVLECCCME